MDKFPVKFTPYDYDKLDLKNIKNMQEVTNLRFIVYEAVLTSESSIVTIDVVDYSDKSLNIVLGELKKLGWKYNLGKRTLGRNHDDEWANRFLTISKPETLYENLNG